MNTVGVGDLLDLVTRGGATAVLLLIVWAFYTDRIVTRATHRRALDERDQFRREWAEALRLVGRATNVADKALKGEEQDGDRIQAQRQVRGKRWNDEHGD